MPRPSWTLYIKPRCPWCAQAIEYLNERGFEFDQADVIRDPAAYERMKKLSGQRLTPTLVIGDDGLLLADFDTDQLGKFLQKHELKPG